MRAMALRSLGIFLVCAVITRAVVATPFGNPGQGLNFWPCETDNDCYDDRKCNNVNAVEGASNCKNSEDSECVCVPEEFGACGKDSDCQLGEICTFSLFHPLHCSIMYDYGYLGPDDESALPGCSSDSPVSSPVVTERTIGVFDHISRQDEETENNRLTYDLCSVQTECVGDRQCVNVLTQSCCRESSDSNCVCLPPRLTFCSNDDDCETAEEECLRTRVDPPRCVSRTARENFVSDPLEDKGVCIAAVHLQHLTTDELVFERHVPARVLCDQFGSCATAGHMVVFHDVAMTMTSYCQQIGNRCSVRQMTVNSPVYQRQLRIPSRTAGLSFTTFAASHETWIEERFLQAAIRLGL